MSCHVMAAILGSIEPEIVPFDPPTLKTPPHGTKQKVDRMTSCEDMAIRIFPRWRPAASLDLIEPEIAPFDPQTPKTLP